MHKRHTSVTGGSADESTPAVAGVPLPPGTPAPAFSLPSTTGAALSLSGFRGQPMRIFAAASAGE